MTEDSGPGDRPRVVVAVGTSVDGRVALRREGLLMDEKERQVWESLNPPSAAALGAVRESYITERYHPQAYLEGSGSLVTDDVGPRSDLPTDFAEPDSPLWLRHAGDGELVHPAVLAPADRLRACIDQDAPGPPLFDELAHLALIPYPLLGSGAKLPAGQVTAARIQHACAEVPAATL